MKAVFQFRGSDNINIKALKVEFNMGVTCMAGNVLKFSYTINKIDYFVTNKIYCFIMRKNK